MDDGRIGARLRTAPPSPKPECWRCAEDRRKLYRVQLVVEGNGKFGPVLVCGMCLASQVHLDPDPLSINEAA